MARVLQERVKTAQTIKSSQACRNVRPVVVPVNKGIPLIALQECGPDSASFFQKKLGADWECFAADSEDPVAIFWDTKVSCSAGL